MTRPRAVTAPKPRRHLMTPGYSGSPPRPHAMSTATVQKWVLTVLTVVLIGHLVEALVIFAMMVPEARESSAIGLLVLAAITGVLAVVGVRAIHGRRILSLWLLLGVVPAGIGAVLALGSL